MTYYIDLSYEDIATNLHRRFATQDAPFSDTFGDTSASERAVDQANVAGFSRKFQQKVSAERAAEGRGLEPPTPCGAPDFESGC